MSGTCPYLWPRRHRSPDRNTHRGEPTGPGESRTSATRNLHGHQWDCQWRHRNAVTGRTDNSDLGPFTRGELEIVQPLYTFGRLSSEILAASRGVDAKRAATQNARDATIASVKELYYNLLLSRQLKELLDEVRENFTKALATAEKRLETGEGTITQQEILKLRIGLASVTREVYTLERAIAVTRSALLRQVGLPLTDDADIADTRLEPVTVQLQPLSRYLEQAGIHRADIAQLEAGLAARQARVEAARGAYYPSFFIAGGVRYAKAPNRESQESPFAKDDFNYFNGGRHWACAGSSMSG